MVEHDELMNRAVAGLRARRSPAPGAEARVLAAIELELGGPSGGGGGGDASTAPVTAGWIAKVVGATAGLAAGGLLLVRVSVGVARALAGEPPVAEQPVIELVEAEPSEAEPEPVVDQPPPAVDLDGPAISPDADAPTRPRTSKPAELEPPDPLAAELALIGAAKRASSPSAALEQLEQHQREHPDGAMASEREALAVVALCRLDRTSEARARARALIAERPGMPLLDRMRRDCPALADLLRQTSP